jgi:hypothetical protein
MIAWFSQHIRKLGQWINFAVFNTLWVLGVGVLLYLGYLLMDSAVPGSEAKNSTLFIFKHLLQELSTAFLIAYVVGFSAEYWNRRRQDDEHTRMMNDISKNVYEALYSRDVPPEVFSEVKKRILEAKFLRKNFRLEITLKRHTPANEHEKAHLNAYGPRVKVSFRQRFAAHNITKEPQEWVANLQVDRRVYAQMADETNHFKDFSVEVFDDGGIRQNCHRYERRSGNVRKGWEDITPLIDNSDPRYQAVSRAFTIPAGGWACFDTTYEQLHPVDGADAICCTHPADGLRATMVIPDGDFIVEAMSMHPESEVDMSKSDDLYLRNFEIQQALLPGQGIYYRWYPRVGIKG